MISELTKIGLSLEEAKTYVACLEVNGGAVSTIAKKAQSNRVSCYHTLENLLKKRFVTRHTKNNIQHYAPESPENILALAQEKVNLTKGILPELNALIGILDFKPKIRVYEGKDGIGRIFRESLEAKSEILGYTNLKRFIDFSPDLFREYTGKKLNRNIKTRYLSPNIIETVDVIRPFLPKKYNQDLLEILLVNKNQFPFDNEILIFDNSVCVVSLKPDELMGLIIESQTLARTMKAIFDLAWLGATAFLAK